MIGITARFRIKPGREAEFESLVKGMIDAVRAKEPGNIFYGLFRKKKTGEYAFIERWRDKASIEAHGTVPHVTEVRERFIELLDGPMDMNEYDDPIPPAEA